MATITERLRAILEAEDRGSDTVKRFDASLAGLGKTAAGVAAGLIGANSIQSAFNSLVRVLRVSAREVQNADDQFQRLESSLEQVGQLSSANVNALRAQSAEIQRTSEFSQDAATGIQALLTSMGLTTEQVLLATQASADLSASLDISLESAARNVGRTIGGFAGELGELIPELKEFSAESLRAGDGIDFLSQRFSGAAARNAEDLTGSITQLVNSFTDLPKFAVEGAGGVDTAADAIRSMAQIITEFGPTISNFAAGIRDVGDGASNASTGIGDLAARANELSGGFLGEAGQVLLNSTVVGILRLVEAQGQLSNIQRELAEQDVEFLRRIGALEEGVTSVNEAERERAETLERIAEAQERANRINREAAAAQSEVDEALKAFGITVKDTNAEISALETFLVDLEEKFRDGKIEIERYELTVAAVQDKLSKLRGDAEDVVPALSAVEAGFSSLAGSTDAAAEGAETVSKSFERLSSGEFFQGIKDLVREINELTSAFENAGVAASLINLGGGGGGGGGGVAVGGGSQTVTQFRARSARNQAAVDAAIASGVQPNLGGTRIRTRSGSVLVDAVQVEVPA